MEAKKYNLDNTQLDDKHLIWGCRVRVLNSHLLLRIDMCEPEKLFTSTRVQECEVVMLPQAYSRAT